MTSKPVLASIQSDCAKRAVVVVAILRRSSQRGPGNVFDSLWHSIIIAVMPLVVGPLLLPETKDRDITK